MSHYAATVFQILEDYFVFACIEKFQNVHREIKPDGLRFAIRDPGRSKVSRKCKFISEVCHDALAVRAVAPLKPPLKIFFSGSIVDTELGGISFHCLDERNTYAHIFSIADNELERKQERCLIRKKTTQLSFFEFIFSCIDQNLQTQGSHDSFTNFFWEILQLQF